MKDIVQGYIDAMYSGPVTGPLVPLAEPMTATEAVETIARFHRAYPEMREAHDRMVLVIQHDDIDNRSKESLAVKNRWGDPMSDPLTHLQSLQKEVMALSSKPTILTLPRRVLYRIKRFQLGKRAFRRWRGKSRW